MNAKTITLNPMKLIWSITILIIINGCGPANTRNESDNSQTSTDSLAPVAERSPVTYPGNQQTISNFPDYSSVIITEDPFEAEVAEGIDNLVATHDPLQLLTFKTSYHREREYVGDYGEILETQELTETWFFDLTYKLRAYSRKYYRDGEGRENKLLIAFFVKDSLVALDDWRKDDNQIGLEFSKKLLTSKCPKCGTDAEREAGSDGKIANYINADDYNDLNNTFITNLSELIDEEMWANAKQAGELATTSENIERWPNNEGDGKPYIIEYEISKDLLSYYKFYAFADLFNNSGKEISESQARFYLEGEEGASYSTENMLENETGYFLLYTKFKAVGPGLNELYAISFTKDAQLKSNFLLGSSYPSSGPDGDGEDYNYNYNAETHILTVITTTITWDNSSDQEIRKEETSLYKLNGDGSITLI